MAEDSGREQRQWPSEHYHTFTPIQKIGDQKFDSFDTDTVISNERPWRGQIKVEAERVAQRAGRLLGQDRDEAGWRFALENDLLHRFHVEVAWYGLPFACNH
ncbi:hypothetical protein AYL99_06897 [Fonsecaea erecta]|uniref:Uncharacterized protein n=1 Tax=Fonsecaea erecta TaxID=1367422 RepID=A0A178ZII5_9EURO|nr:hypothetical protein AYL99_06897 [Fonsecaea erecta]OAP59599.1 hypothetical protein AYL99_06897 [Fonsecaea erecta]